MITKGNPNTSPNRNGHYDTDANGRFIIIQQTGKTFKTPLPSPRFSSWSEAERWCKNHNALGNMGGNAIVFYPAELG